MRQTVWRAEDDEFSRLGARGIDECGEMMTAMTDALKQRWDRVAQRLRAELGEDLYTSLVRSHGDWRTSAAGRLTVSVPTRFLKSWIETHYVSKLQKIGEAELGPLDSVQVRVRSNGTACSGLSKQPRDAGPSRKPLAPVPATCRCGAGRGCRQSPQLDPNQTFDTFVVGSSNQLAHAAVCRVADAAAGRRRQLQPALHPCAAPVSARPICSPPWPTASARAGRTAR